jgi:hypothetical protein
MQAMTPCWICLHCTKLMPKSEAQVLAASEANPDDLKSRVCSSCGAAGGWVSVRSPEAMNVIADFRLEVWLAMWQEAGYEVDMYSAACDRGDHRACEGKSRADVGYPAFDRCRCGCHKL